MQTAGCCGSALHLEGNEYYSKLLSDKPSHEDVGAMGQNRASDHILVLQKHEERQNGDSSLGSFKNEVCVLTKFYEGWNRKL